jgi:toxin HigB-1
MKITEVVWSKRVNKKIQKLPIPIINKFYAWVTAVKLIGIEETRKSSSLHDEPLKGTRLGQRSIRLNKSYRAIYIERDDKNSIILEVIEVNKHEY